MCLNLNALKHVIPPLQKVREKTVWMGGLGEEKEKSKEKRKRERKTRGRGLRRHRER